MPVSQLASPRTMRYTDPRGAPRAFAKEVTLTIALVRPGRFELPTFAFEARRSSPLSHGDRQPKVACPLGKTENWCAYRSCLVAERPPIAHGSWIKIGDLQCLVGDRAPRFVDRESRVRCVADQLFHVSGQPVGSRSADGSHLSRATSHRTGAERCPEI